MLGQLTRQLYRKLHPCISTLVSWSQFGDSENYINQAIHSGKKVVTLNLVAAFPWALQLNELYDVSVSHPAGDRMAAL